MITSVFVLHVAKITLDYLNLIKIYYTSFISVANAHPPTIFTEAVHF